jgi:hypothetical protein
MRIAMGGLLLRAAVLLPLAAISVAQSLKAEKQFARRSAVRRWFRGGV